MYPASLKFSGLKRRKRAIKIRSLKCLHQFYTVVSQVWLCLLWNSVGVKAEADEDGSKVDETSAEDDGQLPEDATSSVRAPELSERKILPINLFPDLHEVVVWIHDLKFCLLASVNLSKCLICAHKFVAIKCDDSKLSHLFYTCFRQATFCLETRSANQLFDSSVSYRVRIFSCEIIN